MLELKAKSPFPMHRVRRLYASITQRKSAGANESVACQSSIKKMSTEKHGGHGQAVLPICFGYTLVCAKCSVWNTNSLGFCKATDARFEEKNDAQENEGKMSDICSV